MGKVIVSANAKEASHNLLAQLQEMKAHGFPLLLMAGAKHFIGLDGDGGVRFNAVGVGSNKGKINLVNIKYDYQKDLYNLEFWYISKSGMKGDKNFDASGIGIEQLYLLLKDHVVDGKPLPVAEVAN